MPPGTPNWHPVLKKIPLKLIPRSRIRLKTDPPFWKYARVKIRPPCTLKHRLQQEYNSLLVNALNRIDLAQKIACRQKAWYILSSV